MNLFKRALPGNDYPDYKELLNYSIERGYIVHKDCNTVAVKEFLQKKPCRKDFSNTFYKVWEDIKLMTRFEILCDQIIYYWTRYNPNNLIESEIPTVLFENLKPILPIKAEEACTKCEDMLASGIALSKETIENIFDVFEKCSYLDKVDINKIKNREARIVAFKKLNKLPTDANEFVRYLVYLATDSALIIKNKETFSKIVSSALDVSEMMNKFGISKLASIYGRFKLIFLSFKHANKKNINAINKLTKKSKSDKLKSKDKSENYFQTLLTSSEELNKDKLVNKLKELNNFKKIALLETINLYLMELDYQVFTIRNSKIWVKLSNEEASENKKKPHRKVKEPKISFPLPFKKYKTSKKAANASINKNKLKEIYTVLYDSLISSLQTKYANVENKQFRIPEGVALTAPKSEKSFVGEYPFGSSLSLANKDAIVGISWDLEDNAADLDLSLLNMENHKIGWNSNFRDGESKILFSGDVVEAPGTELIYAASGFNFDSGVYLNLYRMQSGKNESKASFKFFVAREEIQENKLQRNYMIDPNHIIFSTKIEMESKEMLIGFVAEGKFIFSTFRSNDSRVSYGNKYNSKLIQFNLAAQKCHLDLRSLLVDAGFKETTADKDISEQKNEKEELVYEFDSKADLINFFKN